MQKPQKKSEFIVSLCIICFSVFLSFLLINKYIFNQTESTQSVNKAYIDLSAISGKTKSKTLVLALQTNCRYCNESAPFYKHLVETAEEKNIKLVAVFPTGIEESRTHLNKLGLNKLDVKQASLDSLKVDGTPTLILVNEKGEIINYWVGKLPPNKESEVINKLISEG